MVNSGKMFEKDFENSCPKGVFIERVRDLLYMRGSSSDKDYIVYKYPKLFLFELKSHKGKSIPIKEVYKNGKLKSYGVISVKQLEGLNQYRGREDIKAGFIFNFREYYSTYFISVDKVYDFVKNGERASIPIEWCDTYGVRIPQTKKRVRWNYDFRFLDLI